MLDLLWLVCCLCPGVTTGSWCRRVHVCRWGVTPCPLPPPPSPVCSLSLGRCASLGPTWSAGPSCATLFWDLKLVLVCRSARGCLRGVWTQQLSWQSLGPGQRAVHHRARAGAQPGHEPRVGPFRMAPIPCTSFACLPNSPSFPSIPPSSLPCTHAYRHTHTHTDTHKGASPPPPTHTHTDTRAHKGAAHTHPPCAGWVLPLALIVPYRHPGVAL